MSEDKKIINTPHIERESAGYITGENSKQRKSKINRIWSHIKKNTAHYRAPGHHPVSSPKLVKKSRLVIKRSELHIDHKPGRHIFYMDTLDLAFKRASIQIRLEIKQKQRKGYLKEEFAEVTIKIGDKADQRIEEAIKINLKTWEAKGFHKALNDGIEAEIKRTERKFGEEKAVIVRTKFKAFKFSLKEELKKSTDQKLSELKPYILAHLNRDTVETEFSPCDNSETILEVKTDDCEWETVLGDTGAFAQIEFEHIQGNPNFFRRELSVLARDKKFGIQETGDSKEDPAMRSLSIVLLPQNNSKEEINRVKRNREIIGRLLKELEFRLIENPSREGISIEPSPLILKAA